MKYPTLPCCERFSCLVKDIFSPTNSTYTIPASTSLENNIYVIFTDVSDLIDANTPCIITLPTPSASTPLGQSFSIYNMGPPNPSYNAVYPKISVNIPGIAYLTGGDIYIYFGEYNAPYTLGRNWVATSIHKS